MAFSFQDGPGAEPAQAPAPSSPLPIAPHPNPLPHGEGEPHSSGHPEAELQVAQTRTTWGKETFYEVPRRISAVRRWLTGARFRIAAFDWARAGIVVALSAWLVVALFRPQEIPLYDIHITNVKLAREIGQMEADIARLSKEKERRVKLLDRMEWDAIYWEAMARETGLTREREHVVRSRGKAR